MKKISNTEENNQYYKLINGYIDEYITNNKISPKSLKSYFKNSSKLESFLKRYKLDEIEGIKRVVNDVIDDWHFIQSDGVMKFEKFSILNEDLGKVEIEEVNQEYEKILADLYHTSVGHVNIVDKKEHKFTVKDFGEEIDVIVYSSDDIKNFKNSILPILLEDANNKDIDIFKIDIGLKSGKEIKTSLNFKLEDVVDGEKLFNFISKSLSDTKLLQIIHSFINDYDVLKSGNQYVYKQEYKSYHIWNLKAKASIIK